MPRLFNRNNEARNRRDTRIRVLANTPRFLKWINKLDGYQKKRNTGHRLSNNNKKLENYFHKNIHNHFRIAGQLSVLPRTRVNIIKKLLNVYNNAKAIINAREQQRLNNERRRANARRPATIRRVNAPSLNVQIGKRMNGRGPNIVVISPNNKRIISLG
jgi:hypothetical protein